MNKVWRVAATEYLNAVRSKAFIVGVLAVPLIMAISIGDRKSTRLNSSHT